MTLLLRRAEVDGRVGTMLGRSRWLTVTQEMIHDFGVLTHDEQWIHLDVERAQREMGGTIAHGFLTLSLLSTLVAEIWTFEKTTRAFNYGFNKLRFPASVSAGARIRLVETLVKFEDRGETVLLTRDIAVEIEGAQKPAIAGEWIALLYVD